MAVLKYYDGSDWEPVVSALQGPTGPTGAASNVTGPTGPTGPAGDFSSVYSTNAQTGTTYSLVTGDAGKIVEVSNTSAITLTVPTNTSQPLATGANITVLQTNTGQISITGAVGVTVNATPGLKLRAQWSSATLIKRGTDTWVAIGDLVS
jgi:hypothetical protein